MGTALIDHIVHLLREHGVREVILTLGAHAPLLIKHVESANYGIAVRYVVENEPLGTAGGVKNARKWLDDTFLVVSGDALTDADLSAALRFHAAHEGKVTMLLKQVENIFLYGMVVTDGEGRVRQFLEKPKSEREVVSRIANTGMYVIDPDVLDLIPDGEFFDFARNLFPLMLERGLPLYGKLIDQYWCDVGSLGDYLRAHADALEGKVRLPLAWRMSPKRVHAEGALVDPRAFIRAPVYIGRGARVEQNVSLGPYAVVAPGAVLRRGSFVSDSVIGPGAHVGEGAEVIHSVIAAKTLVLRQSRVVGAAVNGLRVKGLVGNITEPLAVPEARRRWAGRPGIA